MYCLVATIKQIKTQEKIVGYNGSFHFLPITTSSNAC
jgi:hypothetical protein